MDNTPHPTGSERRAAKAAAAARTPKAGRNLPAAIGVGSTLAALVILSLAFWKEAFLILATLAVAVGVWELHGGLAQGRIKAPLVPTVLGALVMLPAAYYGGGDALALTFAMTGVAVLLWRAADGLAGAAKDVAAGFLVAGYAPLLAGFAALMLAADDGAWRIFVFVLVTVSSDIGGYAVGVVKGRHPMAPSVSPKMSWEGFTGSVVTCVVVAVVCMVLALDGPWWGGVLLGVAIVVAATVGDLGESLLKRDLGITDMGDILPGHGGVMDRLDSLVFAAPVAWVLFAVFLGS
jgi:phosphatidate cytidylyltransferase